MATKDSGYSEPNARDGSFTQAETAVVLWAIGASTRWEKAFFDLVAESDPVTLSELHLVFPNLCDAYRKFIEGDLRERWAASHTELAASLRVAAKGGDL